MRITDALLGRSLLRAAIALARDHFRKEEMVAFPLAAATMGEAELRTLGGEWARRRRVEVKG